MNDSFSRELEIFAAAVKLSDANALEAYLKEACAGDAELRQRVEALLKAHLDAGTFLQNSPAGARTILVSPLPGPNTVTAPLTEQPGDRIGRYKLLQKIGEGGCGVVYMAEQEEPVRRRVALKVIKLGMDTKSVIARFEAERQALALMDHPNIAKVLDAGATDAGRPYFVMELVRGVRITDYCDEAKLSTRERLDLFIQVCQAIQHAHQKGIIHRDIKPSNILVTVNDGVPVPKVIDFGIAKATNQQQLTDKTLFTAFEQFIGTPAYMSPEQAVMTSLDIDTRSDIYALGVLLYELLTGKTPFDPKELMQAGLDEIRRTIREVEPPRPSTCLSTMIGADLTNVAKLRHSEPAKLATLIRGDLDWIVMKALERDRTRRYETANGFATDVRRHLDNEPVIARPPSAGYRFQKMVRRNKGVFAAVGAVASALVFGLILSGWQAIRASHAEHQQRSLRNEAESARTAESKQRTIAEQRVYGSLVREAQALRLARRVGYRDKVFVLLQQAAAIEGAQKNFGELRREAVACLGDFVGRTPVTFTDWPTGFIIMDSELAPSGHTAAFGLWDRPNKKTALIVRQVPDGKYLVREVTGKDIHAIGFIGTNRLTVLDRPYLDTNYANAEVAIWTTGQNGEWSETSRRRLPGAYRCISSPTRLYILVDDPLAGTLNLVDPDTLIAQFRVTISKSAKNPPQVVMSGDGRFLAIQAVDSPEDQKPEIAIWNLDLGKEVLRRTAAKSEVIQSLSSDGKYLTMFNTEKEYLTVCDAATLEPLCQLPDVVLSSGGAPVLPGHNIIAIPSYMTRQVRLFDYLRQEVLATLNEPRNPHRVSFSADGRSMLTVGVLYARLYDLADGKEQRHLKGRPDAFGVALHPGGSRVAILGIDGVLTLQDMETGRITWQKGNLDEVGVGYSSDGNLLIAASGRSQETFVIDAQNGERLLTIGTNAPGFTHDALVSDNGRYLVTSSSSTRGGGDGTALMSDDPNLGLVSIWELENAKELHHKLISREVRRIVGKYCSFVFLGSSTRVAFMDYDMNPSVYVLDVASTNSPTKLPLRPRWSFGNLAATPDGRRLWMIDFDGRLICVDSATGSLMSATAEGLDRMDIFGAAGVTISPDGTKLAVGSTADRSLEIFDGLTGRLMYNLPTMTSAVGSYNWGSDSQRLVVKSWNGDVSIWNLAQIDRTLADLGLTEKRQALKPAGSTTKQPDPL